MTPKIVTTTAELLDVIRDRQDDLDLAHSTIDALAGLQDGYFSKLVAPVPIKNFGEMSLGSVLGALALGMAVVVIFEDVDQAEIMRRHWKKRGHGGTRRRRCVVGAPINEEN